MADTQPLAPTDAELMDLGHECELDAIAFGRAVLARWGAQPSPAEFALQALVAAGHVSQELVDKAMTLPGAPQPAHSGKSFQTYGETRAYSKGYYAGKKAALVSQPAWYALVPVEPTPEMVDAAQEAYMPFGDMQLAIQLAIAAAPQPVVGVEPAQWQKRHQLRTNGEWENTNEHDAKWWRDNSQGWEIRALYTTPQPTQAQAGAVPMSHEKAKALVLKYGIDPLHLVLQVERHHGIKGDQHGTE